MLPARHCGIFKTVCVALIALLYSNLIQGLSSGSKGERRRHPTSQVTIRKPIKKESSTLVGIHEGDFARRILKQRSSRRRAAELLPEVPKPIQSEVREQQSSETTRTKEIPPQVLTKLPRPKRTTSKVRAIDIPYESTIQALRVYHEEHSHLVMPRVYLIEESNEFPKEWHGLDLAGTVYDMKWWLRHVKEQPERVAELNKLGFVWERLQPEWNLILEALVTYRTLNNDLLVPASFVVPFGDNEWSRSTWGISLGRIVYRIRSRGDFIRGHTALKRREQLEALGFVWDVSERLFEIFCRALRIYSTVEAVSSAPAKRLGAMKIPARYVVPESQAWPRDLWGYPLGVKCTAVRQKELYIKDRPERLKELADIGYHVGGNDSLKWLEVVHAAAVYSQMHGRNLDVPQHFVVPAPPTMCSYDDGVHSSRVIGSDDAWPWPGAYESSLLFDVDVGCIWLRIERKTELLTCSIQSIFGDFPLVSDFVISESRAITFGEKQRGQDEDNWMPLDLIGIQRKADERNLRHDRFPLTFRCFTFSGSMPSYSLSGQRREVPRFLLDPAVFSPWFSCPSHEDGVWLL